MIAGSKPKNHLRQLGESLATNKDQKDWVYFKKASQREAFCFNQFFSEFHKLLVVKDVVPLHYERQGLMEMNYWVQSRVQEQLLHLGQDYCEKPD
jgi:hypothetical protein